MRKYEAHHKVHNLRCCARHPGYHNSWSSCPRIIRRRQPRSRCLQTIGEISHLAYLRESRLVLTTRQFNVKLFGRGLPNALQDVQSIGSKATEVGASILSQATHVPTEVTDSIKGIASAGETLISKYLPKGVSAGTKHGVIDFGDNRTRIDFGMLYDAIWLCFGFLVVSNICFSFAYWSYRPLLRSVLCWVVSFSNVAAWGFSVLSIWATKALLTAAQRLQDAIQDMFHGSGYIQRGSLLPNYWVIFSFTTCQIFLSPFLIYYSINRARDRIARG